MTFTRKIKKGLRKLPRIVKRKSTRTYGGGKDGEDNKDKKATKSSSHGTLKRTKNNLQDLVKEYGKSPERPLHKMDNVSNLLSNLSLSSRNK